MTFFRQRTCTKLMAESGARALWTMVPAPPSSSILEEFIIDVVAYPGTSGTLFTSPASGTRMDGENTSVFKILKEYEDLLGMLSLAVRIRDRVTASTGSSLRKSRTCSYDWGTNMVNL